MDTSETYIKMNQMAMEIQNSKSEQGLAHGDYCYDRVSGRWDIIYDESRGYRYGLIGGMIWLPRQDQLQEMVGGYFHARIMWGEWLEYVYPHLGYGDPFDLQNRFTSFEQEWLAFVMKEKFGKVWNGIEWMT